MTKINVDVLREQYPDIVIADFTNKDDYCVGGALCAYADGINAEELKLQPLNFRFPRRELLAIILKTLNPVLNEHNDLDENDLELFVEDIIHFNDKGKFEQAWQTTKDALNWRNL